MELTSKVLKVAKFMQEKMVGKEATAQEIVKAMNDEEITNRNITALVNSLTKKGFAVRLDKEKEVMTEKDGKKVIKYHKLIKLMDGAAEMALTEKSTAPEKKEMSADCKAVLAKMQELKETNLYDLTAAMEYKKTNKTNALINALVKKGFVKRTDEMVVQVGDTKKVTKKIVLA